MLNFSSNWLVKYRLNPDWFFPDDESELEKTNREEIFEFIKNHDLLLNNKLENRDFKISHLVGEDYLDPLLFLNPYLDALFGKIDLTMQYPNIITYYIEYVPPFSFSDLTFKYIDVTPGTASSFLDLFSTNRRGLTQGKSVLNSKYQIKSKNVSSTTIHFDNIEKMIEFIDENRKENELFVYLISVLDGSISFRCCTFPKSLERYK